MCRNHRNFLWYKSVVSKAKDHQKSDANPERGYTDSRTSQSNLKISLFEISKFKSNFHQYENSTTTVISSFILIPEEFLHVKFKEINFNF